MTPKNEEAKRRRGEEATSPLRPCALASSPLPLTFGIDASRAARARHTGTETYAFELIKAMARHVDPLEQRLRLYTPHPPEQSDWPDSPPWVETCVIPFPRLWTHLRLSAELHRRPPDALFVPAHVLPLSCPVPALVTVHDLGYRHYPQAHRPFDRRYLEWSTRRHTRVARHILADSQATKDDLVNFYGANPQRISVVYLGRDEALMGKLQSYHGAGLYPANLWPAGVIIPERIGVRLELGDPVRKLHRLEILPLLLQFGGADPERVAFVFQRGLVERRIDEGARVIPALAHRAIGRVQNHAGEHLMPPPAHQFEADAGLGFGFGLGQDATTNGHHGITRQHESGDAQQHEHVHAGIDLLRHHDWRNTGDQEIGQRRRAQSDRNRDSEDQAQHENGEENGDVHPQPSSGF